MTSEVKIATREWLDAKLNVQFWKIVAITIMLFTVNLGVTWVIIATYLK